MEPSPDAPLSPRTMRARWVDVPSEEIRADIARYLPRFGMPRFDVSGVVQSAVWYMYDIRVHGYVSQLAEWRQVARYWTGAVGEFSTYFDACFIPGGMYQRLTVTVERWEWDYEFPQWNRTEHY